MEQDNKPRIGISACVGGEKVRFDGGHKRSGFVVGELARHFALVPLCPEVGIGLGVPRPTLRLIQTDNAVKVGAADDSGVDVTGELRGYADKNADALTAMSGFVFCAKSPSCGMERVPVYRETGEGLGKIGEGAFAGRIKERFPLLPLEENGRLMDPLLRENFVMRVLAYHRWQSLRQGGLSKASLETFHRGNKLLLLCHNQAIYRQMGPLVADAPKSGPELEATADDYAALFMQALASPASRNNHVNTLMHIQGFFKDVLKPEEKAELDNAIKGYLEGHQPLMGPLTLIRLFLRLYPQPWLEEQTYLQPYPEDLQLRYGL